MRMNMGCGPEPVEGWVNIDRDDYGGNPLITVFDFAADEPLPHADGSFDLVVAHHSLQMVDYLHIRTVLRDVYRVLRDGGRFRVSVPSIEKAIRAHANKHYDWFPIVDQAETSIDGKFCAYLTWYSEARTVFTDHWLTELMRDVGFTNLRSPYEWYARPGEAPRSYSQDPCVGYEWEADLDTRIEESLWIVGEK